MTCLFVQSKVCSSETLVPCIGLDQCWLKRAWVKHTAVFIHLCGCQRILVSEAEWRKEASALLAGAGSTSPQKASWPFPELWSRGMRS